MPVYVVRWESSGYVTVLADTPEKAEELAKAEAIYQCEAYAFEDVTVSKARPVSCLEEAYAIDPTLSGMGDHMQVTGSKQTLRELLPSNPNYTNQRLAKLKALAEVVQS